MTCPYEIPIQRISDESAGFRPPAESAQSAKAEMQDQEILLKQSASSFTGYVLS